MAFKTIYLLSILVVFNSMSSAQEKKVTYPNIPQAYQFEAVPSTNSFSQNGTISVIMYGKAVDPTFHVQLRLNLGANYPFIDNGFYQQYFQLYNIKQSLR